MDEEVLFVEKDVIKVAYRSIKIKKNKAVRKKEFSHIKMKGLVKREKEEKIIESYREKRDRIEISPRCSAINSDMLVRRRLLKK